MSRSVEQKVAKCDTLGQSLTDEQIDQIAEQMDGGLDGFLKHWGWRQFARAVEDALVTQQTQEIERLQAAMRSILKFERGRDEDGSLGPVEPFSWQTVALVALDVAHSALAKNPEAA